MKGKVDWLKLEDRIRNELRIYKINKSSNDSFPAAEIALTGIDDILGEETGRGWELEEDKEQPE